MDLTNSSRTGQQARVLIWCTPRSVSTVLCKCLSFVPNSRIFLDPFVVPHFSEKILELDGKVVDYDADNISKDEWRKAAWSFAEEEVSDDIINYDMLKYPQIKTMLDNPDPNQKLILSKATTASLSVKHFRFLPDKSSNYKHSFLLRHPAKLFTSWKRALYGMMKASEDESGLTKSLEDFDLRYDVPPKHDVTDEMFKQLYDLWQHVRENLDPDPVVMESDDLLADPAGMLPKFCNAVGIPYSDSLLTWDESPAVTETWKAAFMPWSRVKSMYHFIERAIHSTHFIPPPPVPNVHELPDDVKEYVKKWLPLYEEITKSKLKPSGK